jgi:hypothetical protein
MGTNVSPCHGAAEAGGARDGAEDATAAAAAGRACVSEMQRRKLNLKAQVQSSASQFSFKRLVPGGLNLGLIGSTCTALPRGGVPLRGASGGVPL